MCTRRAVTISTSRAGRSSVELEKTTTRERTTGRTHIRGRFFFLLLLIPRPFDFIGAVSLTCDRRIG